MTCAVCAGNVEKIVRGLPGVQEANVNLAANLLTVTFDPQLLSVEAMKRNLLLILAPEREGLVPPLPGRIAQRMASGEAYRAGAAETPISFKTETQKS